MKWYNRIPALLVVALLGAGTALSAGAASPKVSPPITIQTIDDKDPLVGKMLTLCLRERLGQLTRSEISISDSAPTGNGSGLVIRGMICRKDINTSSASSSGAISVIPNSGFGMSQSKGNAYAGNIVEGVSLVVSIDGKEIESETYFQAPRKGTYLSPQAMVQVVADRLCGKLRRNGTILKR